MNGMRRFLALGWVLAIALGALGLARAAGSRPEVVEIPITGTVDDGMAHMVRRAVDEADRDGAAAIVLDVNSPGGLVSSAFEIRDALFSAKEPVIAYVSERAYSAAALITLSAKTIEMAPGASIGAAEPIPATEKMISALRAEFESTALKNGRNAMLVGAMVDKRVDVPEYKASGAILTLNTTDARRAHIADGIAPTMDAALAAAHLQDATVLTSEYTFGEQLARFATSPEVSGLLLTLGMLGLLIEMQTLHGIAGVIGVSSLALFFGSHVYSGFSNVTVVALAIVGLAGILWELHIVPGHGAPGILGGIALLFAVLLAFGIPFLFVAMETVSSAIILTVIGFWLATLIFPQNAWMAKLTLATVQGPEYVASGDYSFLLGKNGTAASLLRPAGVVTIDGHRVDVLTAGEFIPAGTPVRVVRVEGARIFVEPNS